LIQSLQQRTRFSSLRKWSFPTIISIDYALKYPADLATKGLDTVGVIFDISANRDFGSGVIVAGVGIFRFAGV
jgi:hypothetical protein